MIDITDVDLVRFVKEVYALSRPQGLGILHYREGGLSDDEARQLIEPAPARVAVGMDYVHGRACKMTVFRAGDRLTIGNQWFDHSPGDLQELLRRVGLAESLGAPAGRE